MSIETIISPEFVSSRAYLRRKKKHSALKFISPQWGKVATYTYIIKPTTQPHKSANTQLGCVALWYLLKSNKSSSVCTANFFVPILSIKELHSCKNAIWTEPEMATFEKLFSYHFSRVHLFFYCLHAVQVAIWPISGQIFL